MSAESKQTGRLSREDIREGIKRDSHLWISDERIFEARPIDDWVNDGNDAPDNKKIKWVVFMVSADRGKALVYDGFGFAETLRQAQNGDFVS